MQFVHRNISNAFIIRHKRQSPYTRLRAGEAVLVTGAEKMRQACGKDGCAYSIV